MSERFMNIDRFIVIVLWVLVLGLAKSTLIGAIFFGLGESWVRLTIVALLPLTALAAVLNIRCYSIRLASVIRGTASANQEVRQLRH